MGFGSIMFSFFIIHPLVLCTFPLFFVVTYLHCTGINEALKLNKQMSPDLQNQELLPVHFLLHVGGVAAAVVGQQEAAVAQPVDIDLNVGAVHHDDISCWGLASNLQEADMIIHFF